MSEDETAHSSLTRRAGLEEAGSFLPGWKELIMMELDQMRAGMPYADTLELRLTCRREPA